MSDFLKQRYSLLFKDLTAADGGGYGVRVVGYDEEKEGNTGCFIVGRKCHC